MSDVSGMSVEQVDNLSQRFRSHGDEVGSVIGKLRAALETTPWAGTDRDQFVAKFDGQIKGDLTMVQNLLLDTADKLRLQAEDQRRTSGS